MLSFRCVIFLILKELTYINVTGNVTDNHKAVAGVADQRLVLLDKRA